MSVEPTVLYINVYHRNFTHTFVIIMAQQKNNAKLGEQVWSKMSKVVSGCILSMLIYPILNIFDDITLYLQNAELLTLTYGSMITQVN